MLAGSGSVLATEKSTVTLFGTSGGLRWARTDAVSQAQHVRKTRKGIKDLHR
jgi:hypothetical protein